ISLDDDLTPPDARGRVAILQEAWMPPIQEFLEFLEQLRTRLAQRAPIHILLIGHPEGDTLFTPVTQLNHEVWVRALERLADPWLITDCPGGIDDG
ncbi:MAG: DUF2868 domain-containing protein, partial [Verrucomicrobiota bacterium]